jgi:DNA invertase Pin-like site-specific DNA recombinase
MGHIVLTVLGMVAQMERRFIKERQRDGIEQAKRNGICKGGQQRFDHTHVIQLHRDGLKPTEIAKVIGCSRMQVYRILDGRAKLQHEPTEP